MDALDIESAHLVGNSMGGRVALEIGLRRPERVRSIAALCPAVAFIKRDFHPLVRLLRPELGLLPHKLRRGIVERQLWSMFCDPDALDPSVADVVVDEFQRHLRQRRRARRLLRLGAQHLPRPPVRRRRLLPAAGRAASRRRCSSGARTTS